VAGDSPIAEAPGAYPALRYVCVVDDGDRTAAYYETGCEDGSHELRREWFPRGANATLGDMRGGSS
jgi:hypothetical protein